MTATLYYTPTSCGAASFIVAHKTGLLGTKISAAQVDIGSKKILTGPNAGDDYLKYNPKGNVPTLIDNGLVLNENVATLTYLADLAGDLAPANGTKERYVLLNYLSLIATEIHKGIFGPLFTLKGDAKAAAIANSKAKMTYLDNELKGKKYLVGDKFTVADSYLYIVLSWSKYLQFDLSPYPNLEKYVEGISGLDFVKAAGKAMADMAPKA
jgi:glutathione S-transferase